MKKWKWALCLTFTLLGMTFLIGCGGQTVINKPDLNIPPTAQSQATSAPTNQQPSAPTTTPSTPSKTSASDEVTIKPLANTPLPSNVWIRSIGFWDTQNGVLNATSNQNCTSDGLCENYLALTHDGGHSWQTVAEVLGMMGTLSVEGNAAYVGSRTHTEQQRLLASTDRGATWQFLPVDQKTVGTQRYRAVTTSPCTGEWAFGPISSFPTVTHGWALCNGQGGAGRMGKAIFATQDSGKSWTPTLQVHFSDSPDPGGISKNGDPQGISFFANGHGWMWETRGTLLETLDGGKNWKVVGNITQPEAIEANSVSRLTEQEAYVLLRDTTVSKMRLVYTKDDGKTWQDVTSWSL